MIIDPRISRRVPYLALAVTTIGIGLAIHRGAALGPVAGDVLGDALWAVMMVWWTGVVAPRARLPARGMAALAICFAVEASQIVHSPVLDALRRTVPGRLVLGSGFDPRDLLAYAAGVLAALLLQAVFVRFRPRDILSAEM
jgi:hypothetical protein